MVDPAGDYYITLLWGRLFEVIFIGIALWYAGKFTCKILDKITNAYYNWKRRDR